MIPKSYHFHCLKHKEKSQWQKLAMKSSIFKGQDHFKSQEYLISAFGFKKLCDWLFFSVLVKGKLVFRFIESIYLLPVIWSCQNCSLIKFRVSSIKINWMFFFLLLVNLFFNIKHNRNWNFLSIIIIRLNILLIQLLSIFSYIFFIPT